jgi:hypothetical protein
LKAGLGLTQIGLLQRFGMLEASAAPRDDSPTKLLAIWIDGGLHWESFFSPLTRAGINKFIPAPYGGDRPAGYSPEQVRNFDNTEPDLDDPGTSQKIRGPIYWNWDNPSANGQTNPLTGDRQVYLPWGYVWADPAYRLYERTAVIVGADQGTASHQSGVIASMCGVGDTNFRAPAVQAVVANYVANFFPDRPIANASLLTGYSPLAVGLPTHANPTALTSFESLIPTLSDWPDTGWAGLRSRTEVPNLAFDGSPLSGVVPATVTDAALLDEMRRLRGRSSSGTDALLESLYETYKGASLGIARDVVSVIEATPGFEYILADPMYGQSEAYCIDGTSACGRNGLGPYEFALQLLKSDLVTSVTMRATSFNNNTFDTHIAEGPAIHAQHLRIALEEVGRMAVEMSLTPSSTPGKSLLDETLIYVFSDFGRTFPLVGSDHHPATCAILIGGNIIGNQMVGAYNEEMNGSPMGVPVPVIEESGERVTRTLQSQDVAATVIAAFGLESGADYFLPGGYGVVDGLIPV